MPEKGSKMESAMVVKSDSELEEMASYICRPDSAMLATSEPLTPI